MGCATSGTKHELSKTERAKLYVDLANSSLVEGDPVSALENLNVAEKLDDDLPDIYHTRALAYHAKKDYARALAEAQKAVELQPNFPDASNTLGKILIDLGKFQEAVVPLEKAAQNPMYRESYKAYTNLAILFYKKNQFDKSEKAADNAISSASQQACIAYYYKGHLRLRLSDFKAAIQNYRQATQKFCAGFGDAQLALGIAYTHGGQVDLARRKFLEIQEAYPNTQLAERAVQQLKRLP